MIGYWILLAAGCVLVVVLKRWYVKADDRAAALQDGKDRIKGEFREQDGELTRYKDMCHTLLTSNERLTSVLKEHDLTDSEREEVDDMSRYARENGRHLAAVYSSMRYHEGRLYKEKFSVGSFVSELRKRCEQSGSDMEAELLCIDSGIRMLFGVEYDPMLQKSLLSVTLRIPEGGACCIYEDGVSSVEEDWPPVRACVDTMFAHDKEVYLAYHFEEATKSA